MAVAAVQETPRIVPPPSALRKPVEIRRFELPDLDRHGAWFLPRFIQEFPHFSQQGAIGFIRGILYLNEFHFLYQENAIALAQTMSAHSLQSDPMIWERFVWVRDPENQQQLEAASFFYEHFERWAKRQGVSIIHVDEKTDVPLDLIRERLKKINVAEQKYARV